MIAHGVQTGLSRVICDALGRVVGAAIQYDICDAPPFFNEEERKIMLAESRYFNPRGLSVEVRGGGREGEGREVGLLSFPHMLPFPPVLSFLFLRS